jgi:hypothetical protein
VATGTPEQVARNSHSFTGKFLAQTLANSHFKHNHVPAPVIVRKQ